MSSVMAHCSAAISGQGSLFTVLFMAGLTGGFTHCLAMCGPLVASESAACGSCTGNGCGMRAKTVESTRIMYHLGRAATYGMLGFFAAFIMQQIRDTALWHWLSAIMLVGAGTTFILSSLPRCRHSFFKTSQPLSFLRGAMLGFMPCGLLYAALMMAATASNPFSGMVGMWLFVLGTLPALFVASVGTAVIARKWQLAMHKVGRAMMVFNGLSLLVMAGKLVRM